MWRVGANSVSGRNDTRALDQENRGALRRARAMMGALRYHEPLPRRQLDAAAFEIDEQPSFDDVEELVLVVVMVPVVFALDHAQAHHRFVDLAQRLVPPAVRATVDQAAHVHDLERRMEDVEVGDVRIVGRRLVGHGYLAAVTGGVPLSTPSSRPTCMNASTARSMCFASWAAESWTRIRACP